MIIPQSPIRSTKVEKHIADSCAYKRVYSPAVYAVCVKEEEV